MTTAVSALVKAAIGASHALKSCARGNAAPDLAHACSKALDDAIQAHVDGSVDPYLVWSNDLQGWFTGTGRAFAKDIRNAARLSRTSAMLICKDAQASVGVHRIAVLLQDAYDSLGVKVDG